MTRESKLTTDINKPSIKLRDVPKGTQASNHYDGWKEIVIESMIRGIEGKSVNTHAKDIDLSAQEQGFIESMYFYERFDEFKDNDGTLESFVQKLLNQMK